MLLCLSDTKQTKANLELKKTYKFSETVDYEWKWETRHNAESSQCITKFKTDDRQYS